MDKIILHYPSRLKLVNSRRILDPISKLELWSNYEGVGP